MAQPAISVLIISYKTSELMQKLVDSIKENVVLEILIVDNASTDETFTELELIKDTRVTLLRSEKNLGFTGGINFGLKYITENRPHIKYFFLFNPDALSSPNLIEHLFGILQSDLNIAAVSPQILFPDGKPWYSGGTININKGRVYNNPTISKQKKATYYDVDVFSGCAVLFDLQKVIQAGMFNEDLFMYYDEADMAMRLKERGYRIVYTSELSIFHDVSYTTKNITHLKTYYMTRNKFMVFNKEMTLYSKVYFLLHELAYHLKNGRGKNALFHLKGFIDFVKGKKGSYDAASS